MTHFHEGQEVEVEDIRFSYHEWRNAKIVGLVYHVQFPDGTRAVLDSKRIRAVRPAHNDHFTSDYECVDGNSE